MGRRAFLAVTLGEPAADAVVSLRDRLRREIEGVRWVRSEGLHVTLRFFGDLDDIRLEPLRRAVGAATSEVAPFPIRLGGLGVFPDASRPRVIWVGVTEGAAALGNLFYKVDLASEEAGLGREPQPFRPHCTLGRFRDEPRAVQLPTLDQSLPAFQVEAVDLFESREGYRLMGRFPLGTGDTLLSGAGATIAPPS